jgi:Flp pilus assembly protein TadD
MDTSLQPLLDQLDRLTDEFRELREGVRKAIRIAEDDPEMALTRVRKVMELVVREVYERRIKEAPGTRPLENLIQRLVKDGFFPDRLDAYATTVRKLGNVGTHTFGETITAADVSRSLSHLQPILEWYFSAERPDAAVNKVPGAENPPRIFISYRREDSEHITGRISDRLELRFGRENIFLDTEKTIPFGVDFRAHLDQAIGQCKVLLAVIGERWLDARHQAGPRQGQRRLDDPADLVRIEIRSALARGVPVIPVLVGTAGMPGEQDLPEGLKGLTYRSAAEVRSGHDFHDQLDRLIQGIEFLARRKSDPPQEPPLPREPDPIEPESVTVLELPPVEPILAPLPEPMNLQESTPPPPPPPASRFEERAEATDGLVETALLVPAADATESVSETANDGGSLANPPLETVQEKNEDQPSEPAVENQAVCAGLQSVTGIALEPSPFAGGPSIDRLNIALDVEEEPAEPVTRDPNFFLVGFTVLGGVAGAAGGWGLKGLLGALLGGLAGWVLGCGIGVTIGFLHNRRRTRGDRLVARGRKLVAEGREADALKAYHQALEHDPDHAEALLRLASLLLQTENATLRDPAQALHYARRACQATVHGKGRALRLLAAVLGVLGQCGDARDALEQALECNPKGSASLNNLAWLYATCPDPGLRDGSKAVRFATRACDLTEWEEAHILDTLAAAHAELGEFEEAVRWQSRAIELTPRDDKSDYEARLQLYHTGQPFRVCRPE